MDVKEEVRFFKALADENRLSVLTLLQDGEKCACRLLEALEISQPTLSHHMKLLCDSGIVNCRKEEKWMYYSISPEVREKLMKIAEKYFKAVTVKQCCYKEEKK